MKVVLRRMSLEEIMIHTRNDTAPKTENIEIKNLKTVYNLRARKERIEVKNIRKKKVNEIRTVCTVKNANKLWKDLTDLDQRVHINDIVLAKMATFKPWPAKIINIYSKLNNMRAAWVEFLGTFQVGEVNVSQCVPISMCSELLRSYCQGKQKSFEILQRIDIDRNEFLKKLTKQQIYLQAIRDAEVSIELPFELSFLKTVEFQ